MSRTIILIFGLLVLQVCNQKSEKQEKLSEENHIVPDSPNNIQIEQINKNDVPESIKVKGDLILAKKWKDNNGENILIISRKGPLDEETSEFTEDEKYAELYGEQYINRGNNFELLWDIYDVERHCPFDLWIGCLPNSTQITDLDNDGITETTIVYKLTCRSDVSPSSMKLIMHENDTKMALRGTMILEMDKGKINDDFEYDLSKVDTSGLSEFERIIELFGRYSNENDFKNKPPEFLKFAKESWEKLVDKDEFKQL